MHPLAALFAALLFGLQTSPAPVTSQPVTTQPASVPASAPTPPQVDDVFRELIQRAERPTRTPIEPGPGSSTADQQSVPGLLPDGVQFFQRLGEFRRTGDVSEFRFQAPAPTSEWLEFTKNRLLEALENEAAAGFSEFVLTVDVTQYRGKNYLTLLSFRRAPSHGNLSP